MSAWSGSPRSLAGDRDEYRIAKLERAGRRHLLTECEPAEDHDLVAEHGAARHLPQLRAQLALLVRGEHEDVVAARSLAQRAHRHDDRLRRLSDGHLDAHRGAGRRAASAALEARANGRIARRGV